MLDVSVLRGAVEVALDRDLAPYQVEALHRYVAETDTLTFVGALTVCSPSFVVSRTPEEIAVIESQFLPLLLVAATPQAEGAHDGQQ